MSPLQTGVLASGIAFGAANTACTLMELLAGRDLVPSNVEALITTGTIIIWIGLFSTINREHVMSRLNAMEQALRQQVSHYGAQCTEDGRLDAARDAAREHARNFGAATITTQRTRLMPVE